MPRAFRTYMTVLFVILTIFLVRVSPISAVPITALPEEQATPGFYPASPETAKVTPRANIPEGPVHMFIRRGEQSRFELFFLDAKYDHDVNDFEFYKAWCLEKDKKIGTNALHQVRLYNVYDPDLPPKFKTMPWNQINYIINHKEGSKTVIQDAIWYLADNQKRPISPEAIQLIEKAALKGRDFQPGEGELLAIICSAEGKQAVFIEFPIPEEEVIETFPVSYAPPPPMPELSSLPLWLPLAAVPLITPFVIPDGSSDTPPSVPPSLASNDIPDTPPTPPVNPIPEPSSMLLIGSGLAGLYAWGKIKKRA